MIKAESTLKVNRKSLLLASAGLTVWLLFGLLAPVVVGIVAFVYPALQSLRAIETNQSTAKWLTYWVVYASFTLFETIGRPLQLLQMIPFYFTAKLGIMASSIPSYISLNHHCSCGAWRQSS